MKHVHDRKAGSTSRPAHRRSRRFLLALASLGIISLTVAIAAYGVTSKKSKEAGGGAAQGAQSALTVSTATAAPVTAHHAKAVKKRLHRVHHRQPSHGTPARVAAQPKIITGNPVHHAAPGTGGKVGNDDYQPAGKASEADSGNGTNGVTNPCTLVTRAQAQAITGMNVKAVFAPLGPTCVYQVGAKTQITVALQLAVFAKLRQHIHKLSSFNVDGHAAYCGVYGSPVTYVLMSRDRLLTISAPCTVGAKFAAAAAPRLPS